MISSNNKIHYIKYVKRLSKEILKQLTAYHDVNKHLTFNKRKRLYQLKDWKR